LFSAKIALKGSQGFIMARALKVSNHIKKLVKDLKAELQSSGIDVKALSNFELTQMVIKSTNTHLHKQVDEIYQFLLAQSSEELQRISEENQMFNTHLMNYWEKPLRMLEAFQDYVQFLGNERHSEYLNQPSETQDFKYEALGRLHARACLLTKEILALLQRGFADGAYGRWRTLHDIVVVMRFISEKSQDTSAMYLSHQVIQEHKAITQYNEYYKEINKHMKFEEFLPVDTEYVKELDEKKDLLIKHFGENFASEYGWFAATVQPSNGKYKPNFSDIEEKVGLSYMRPFYKWASNEVHAQSTALFEKLGLLPDMEIVLAGPSVYGISHPAQWTAIYLYMANEALLSSHEDLSKAVSLRACKLWIEDICKEFADAEQQLHKDNIKDRNEE
jgi:hypothetical protein